MVAENAGGFGGSWFDPRTNTQHVMDLTGDHRTVSGFHPGLDVLVGKGL
jgi:hypothetical protein